MDRNTQLEISCINTIRTLAIDAVEKANSGHPGAPMGMAPAAYIFWTEIMGHNPNNPHWFNRDRFILSAGHASALIYSLLALTGYDVSMEDMKSFRQLGSKTPGHPEYGVTPGIETTTGPLGQGFANGVGMAIAESILAARFNRPDFNLIDHYTYAFVGDGDLMEGISYEAASLAGHLGLGKLVYVFDSNKITIDGSTDLARSEDIRKRFESCGWQVLEVEDGNADLDAIRSAVKEAKKDTKHPTLIILNTQIGFGSPNKQGDSSSHGAPLGKEEVKLTKERLGWPYDKDFYVPDDVCEYFGAAKKNGEKLEKDWNELLQNYKKKYPNEAKELDLLLSGDLPAGWENSLPSFTADDGPIATRSVSGKVINKIANILTNLVGGSADLAGSNNSVIKDANIFQREDRLGRNIYFGIREHAMGAIVNGLAVHSGLIPYAATFFIFSDYMRPSLRMAALMGIRSIFIFTHDSIGVGEDGPTHQPIEQLASLRAMPGFTLIRPCDANETVFAWRAAVEKRNGPTAIVLTRQKLPVLDRDKYMCAKGVLKGAYVIKKEKNDKIDLIIIASGSEVSISIEAADKLEEKGASVRVVSMPSWELFEDQSDEYRESVLPSNITARLSVEAGRSFGWHKFVGLEGDIISIDSFGSSAPASDLFKKFGFTVDNIVNRASKML